VAITSSAAMRRAVGVSEVSSEDPVNSSSALSERSQARQSQQSVTTDDRSSSNGVTSPTAIIPQQVRESRKQATAEGVRRATGT
jgi:hypothetical protein